MEDRKQKKKSRWSNLLLILIFLVGLSLLLYPTVSDWWNSFHSTRAISSYDESVAQLDRAENDRILREAEDYNRRVSERGIDWKPSEAQLQEYNGILNVTGSGMMGYIEIAKIHCSLPIYHGTSEPVLQVAVGHIEGSSLPVGGAGSHCILSGHRGLPSARLFTDLDKLTEGDLFTLNILDETLTYEIDQIRIVLPYELNELLIEDGEDYCTLVTCTPYGVNSHRLLVRGHRVENQGEELRVGGDAMPVDPLLVAPAVAAPLLLILLFWLLFGTRKKPKRGDRS